MNNTCTKSCLFIVIIDDEDTAIEMMCAIIKRTNTHTLTDVCESVQKLVDSCVRHTAVYTTTAKVTR